jgi:hypothetical protein
MEFNEQNQRREIIHGGGTEMTEELKYKYAHISLHEEICRLKEQLKLGTSESLEIEMAMCEQLEKEIDRLKGLIKRKNEALQTQLDSCSNCLCGACRRAIEALKD